MTALRTSKPADAIAPHVQVLPEGRAVAVTPEHVSRRVCPAPEDLIPRYGMVKWQPAGDGTYKPILQLAARLMRITEFIKLVDIDYSALRRLVVAKFVAGQATTPNGWYVDVHSYFAHVAAVQADPDFWTEARRAQYSAAL